MKFYLLASNAMYSAGSHPTFRRYISPPSTLLKNKPGKNFLLFSPPWFLLWLLPSPWGMRREIHPKLQLIFFNGLNDVMSQKVLILRWCIIFLLGVGTKVSWGIGYPFWIKFYVELLRHSRQILGQKAYLKIRYILRQNSSWPQSLISFTFHSISHNMWSWYSSHQER
jgi:hypothetical protein